MNEPAGNLAKIIVIHVVKAVITAWDNPNTPAYHVTEMAMECLFHPDFHNPHSAVQKEMVGSLFSCAILALLKRLRIAFLHAKVDYDSNRWPI